MRTKTTLLGLVTFSSILTACATTVPKDAPQEFKDAQASIRAAHKGDAGATAPKTMGLAEEKLKTGLTLLKQTEKDKVSETAGKASAIKDAAAAKKLADNALSMHKDVKKWDENIDNYATMKKEAADATALRSRVHAAENQITSIERRDARAQMEERVSAEKERQARLAEFGKSKTVAYFKSGQTTLTPALMRNVNQLASLMRDDDTLTVTLTGFADRSGSKSVNDKLAHTRAENVANALVDAGVARDRIKVETHGAAKATTTADVGARQLDRRVEATVNRTAH